MTQASEAVDDNIESLYCGQGYGSSSFPTTFFGFYHYLCTDVAQKPEEVSFVSEKDENVWWYDGERIAFRTPNYTKILNAMRTQPTLTLADMKDETGISITAIQKLLDKLISKKYVERGEKEGSWRVFLTQ